MKPDDSSGRKVRNEVSERIDPNLRRFESVVRILAIALSVHQQLSKKKTDLHSQHLFQESY